MDLLDELFNLNHTNDSDRIVYEQSVVVWFDYGLDDLDPLHELAVELDKVLEESGLGMYDGHEIALDLTDGSLYLYGSNAETVFKAVKPTLENCPFLKGAIAVLQFGPTGEDAPMIEVTI